MPARSHWRQRRSAIALIVALAATTTLACEREPPPAAEAPHPPRTDALLSGETMGTTWRVHYQPGNNPPSEAALTARVQRALDHVNALASTWDTTSELSRLNQSPYEQAFVTSAELASLLRRALDLAAASGGAFDPTIPPLLRLYGFGPGAAQKPPTADELKAAQQRVGYHRITIDGEGRVARSAPGIEVDLSAIAKGYGVDMGAQALMAEGIVDFLIEVGGEVRAKGRRADGGPWRVGIELPSPGTPGESGYEAIALLTNKAMATSGDYRQFRFEGAERVHHIIDPRLGRSAVSALASVTVVADDCALADALATTLTVMGAEDGIPFVNQYAPGAEVLWITRSPGGELSSHHTPGFPLAPPAQDPG